jgi:hypothetical protein
VRCAGSARGEFLGDFVRTQKAGLLDGRVHGFDAARVQFVQLVHVAEDVVHLGAQAGGLPGADFESGQRGDGQGFFRAYFHAHPCFFLF